MKKNKIDTLTAILHNFRDDDEITAKQIRDSLGLQLPDFIPDKATIISGAIKIECIDDGACVYIHGTFNREGDKRSINTTEIILDKRKMLKQIFETENLIDRWFYSIVSNTARHTTNPVFFKFLENLKLPEKLCGRFTATILNHYDLLLDANDVKHWKTLLADKKKEVLEKKLLLRPDNPELDKVIDDIRNFVKKELDSMKGKT